MIYYTMITPNQFTSGEAVQLDDNQALITHTTGEALGIVMTSVSPDEGSTWQTKIYAAGGGGVSALLGDTWDGQPSRFVFAGGRVVPTTTRGDGWLIPSMPIVSKVAGDSVSVGIYK